MLVKRRLGSLRQGITKGTDITIKGFQKHSTRDDTQKANQSSSIGLIIRQKEPKVLETPLDRVDSFLTPTELFYVRSHSPAPKLELASYRLHIDGAVRRPYSLTYKELRDMPAETRVAPLGVRRQWSGLPCSPDPRSTVGTRRSRQCRMDRGPSERFAGARRFGRRRLRDRARRT